jgi:uncharacterized protein (DUF433 family)
VIDSGLEEEDIMVLLHYLTSGGPGGSSPVIVRDPEVLGGRPVFRGTRVPVDTLFDNLADGLTVDQILSAHPTLDRTDVLTVLEMARRQLLADTAP